MAAKAIQKWASVSEIAKLAGLARHKIEYAAKRLGIEPLAIVGQTRLYSDDDATQIIQKARRIAVDRGDKL